MDGYYTVSIHGGEGGDREMGMGDGAADIQPVELWPKAEAEGRKVFGKRLGAGSSGSGGGG
jgi:hypothetical protein